MYLKSSFECLYFSLIVYYINEFTIKLVDYLSTIIFRYANPVEATGLAVSPHASASRRGGQGSYALL
jgi:hypothetical protein